RRARAPQRKPLVVFPRQSLRRHRACVSGVGEFPTGSFQPGLGDPGVDPAAVKRVLLCTGKIYYDLLAARAERGITDTALIRLEQLYPLPVAEVRATLAAYPGAEIGRAHV